METNEQIRKVLGKALEEELESFLEQVSQMSEGELKQLEEQVVKSSQAIGRKLMEGVLNSRVHERRPVARRKGSCGHVQRLVGERRKELITLVGPVSFVRAYYQCLHGAEGQEEQVCRHAEAPADVLWGVDKQRTTRGVQGHISYLSARLTFEESAQTMCRTVPIGMAGRQALNLMRPVAEGLAAREDHQVSLVQAQAKQAQSQPCAQRQAHKEIERLYIELDGVFARMRRGSVPMEKEEQQRKGDVYREIKAGAVFRAERGPKRSELAAGVYVDTPAPDSVRYVARRTAKGGFAWLLYQLALDGTGASEAGWWSWVTAYPGFGTWSPNTFQARCRSSICTPPKKTCGTWLTPALDAAQQWERLGLLLLARRWKQARLPNSSLPFLRCPPFQPNH